MESALEMRLRGHHYIGVVKTSHSGYSKAFLEDQMKSYPAGSHLVLETRTKEEIDLIAIGYKYNKKKIMLFICTKGCGHTECGEPYIARWKDRNGATKTKAVQDQRLFQSISKEAISLMFIISHGSMI